MKQKESLIDKIDLKPGFAIILLAFLSFSLPISAQSRLVWRQNFESAEAKALEGENEVGAYTTADGSFRIKIKKSKEGYLRYTPTFDRESDYRVETRVMQDGSNPEYYTALAWDMTDLDNNLLFITSADGRYAILKYQNGALRKLSEWRYSSAIQKKAYNALAVERKGSLLIFSINGTEVDRQVYQSVGGSLVAVMYGGEQTVSIDDVRVYADRPYSGEPIGAARGGKIRYETKFDKASGSWLMGASPPLAARWETALAIPGSAPGSGSPAGYTLTQDKRGALGSTCKTFEFDLFRDFSIFARVRFLSGDGNYGYGLIVDESQDGYLSFVVSSSGSFAIQQGSGSDSTMLVPWEKSPNVELFESDNSLGILRRKNVLIFTINGYKVHEMPYDEWLSTRLGFCLAGAMRVQPLELTIIEEPIKPGAVIGSCDSGFGVWDYEDGRRYAGTWSSGKPHGYGTMYSAEGGIWDGNWIEDNFSGLFPAVDPVYYYPVISATDNAGLVEASGAVLGFGLKSVLSPGEPVENTRLFASGKTMGFIDETGNEQVSTAWSLASGFHEGFAIIKNSDGATGVIDAKGTIVIQPGEYNFNPASRFQGGLIAFQSTGQVLAADAATAPASGEKPLYGLISSGGLVLRKAELLSLNDFSEGLARAKAKNGLYGYLDRAGSWRIPPRYKYAADFSDGLAYCSLEGRDLYIDRQGREVFALDYDQSPGPVTLMREGLAPVLKDYEYLEFLDETGKVAFRLEEESYECFAFSEGRAAFENSIGRWGFLDRTGNVAIAPSFEAVRSFAHGLAAAKVGKLWGYIDKSGAWVIQPVFFEAFPFRPEGLAQVKTAGGWWTWIKPSGEMLWEDKAHGVLVLKEEFSNNGRGWPVGKNESMEAYIQKDYYLLFTNTDAGDMTGLKLPVERGRDHAIAALLRYNSKSKTESAGLIWDLKDAANFLFIAISPQGGYAIFMVKEGLVETLVDWTVEQAVRPGIADNLVEVRREGDALVFFINEVQVKILPWETVQGDAIGFLCMGKTSLVVESLAVWN